MHPSRRILVILMLALVAYLAARIGWSDWQNSRFDQQAIELGKTIEPPMRELGVKLNSALGLSEISDEMEKEVFDMAETVRGFQAQVEALPDTPGRKRVRLGWIQFVQRIPDQATGTLKRIEQLSELPPQERAQGLQEVTQQIQTWQEFYQGLMEASLPGQIPDPGLGGPHG